MPIVRIKLEGYLTPESLGPALLSARKSMDAMPSSVKATLLVDCLAMEDYMQEARSEFVRFASTNRYRVGCIVVVTEKFLWHMVIRAMSLASGVEMRPFSRLDEGEEYASNSVARSLSKKP